MVSWKGIVRRTHSVPLGTVHYHEIVFTSFLSYQKYTTYLPHIYVPGKETMRKPDLIAWGLT